MKTRIAMLVGLLAMWSSAAFAGVSWIDWTSTSAGTLNTGSGTVNVTMTGAPMDLINGDEYFNNPNTGGTAPTGTYAGLAPSDLIRVNGPTTMTLNFSSAISNPYIALVSVGQGFGVTYTFSSHGNPANATLISYGPNNWGYGGYTLAGNVFTGYEYNGVLQFAGSFDTLTISTAPGEFWHGFNIGVNTAAVPEPASLALVSFGLLGLATLRRRKVVTQV